MDLEITQTARSQQRTLVGEDFKESFTACFLMCLSMATLPLMPIASMVPLSLEMFKDLPPNIVSRIRAVVSHAVRELVPKSNISV